VRNGVSAWAAVIALACATTIEARQTPAARRVVAIGCVSVSPGDTAPPPARFILTDTRGPEPATYRLDGDPAKLNVAVGQTVEVAGTLSSGASATAAPLLKVQSITRIAATCRAKQK
jgi:hypothetical protein